MNVDATKEYRLEAILKKNKLVKNVICAYLKYSRLSFTITPFSSEDNLYKSYGDNLYKISICIPYLGIETKTLINCIEHINYYAFDPTEMTSIETEDGKVISQPKNYLINLCYSLKSINPTLPS